MKEENGEWGGADATPKEEEVPSKTKEEPDLMLQILPGLLLLFNYFAHDVSGEEILKSLDAYGNMQWVEFRRSDTEGHICFDTAEQASITLAKVPVNEVMSVGLKHKFELLTGQTTQVFWEDAHFQRIEVRNRKPRWDGGGDWQGRSKRGRGGKGSGCGRGRHRGPPGR